MKKVISIILSLVVMLTCLCSFSVAFASSSAVESKNLSAVYKNTFDLPVNASGVSDMMGFAFEISYNSEYVKPVSVNTSNLTSDGTFNDSIGSQTYVNPMRVVFAGTKAIGSDGTLFTVKFQTFKIGDSQIKITSINEDTYDSSYNQMTVSTGVINVNCACIHQYTKSSVASTCTVSGKDVYTCVICGDTYTQYYPMLSHNFGDNSPSCLVCGISNPNYVAPTQPTTQPATQPTSPVPQPTQPATAAPTTAQISVSKPKSTSVKKVTGSKKTVAVTWSKVSGVNGYEVQVATDKKFKKDKKTVTVKKQKTTKTTIKKLKAKKKYNLRVRTYKVSNGKKVYSAWSKVKTVNTK